MEINKIFSKLNLSNVNKTNSVRKQSGVNGTDEINLSTEFKKIYEERKSIDKYVDIVKKSPNVRRDLVEDMKLKVKNGYFDNINMDKVADKLENIINIKR